MRLLSSFSLLLAYVCVHVYAQDKSSIVFPRTAPEAVGMSSVHLEEMRTRVQAMVDDGKLAGVSYALLKDGKIAALECTGWADVENKVPIDKDTIFRIFSQSKPISTAAFLTLVDEGLVSIDDPVSRYIPEFATVRVYDPITEDTVPLERTITIWHLLTHTSGLTYGFMDNTAVDQMYNNNDILNPDEDMAAKIQRVLKLPLVSQPGSKWQYGLNTDVLLLIASQLTGLTIDEFMHERLLAPLGMTDTGFYVPPAKAHKLATVYQRDPVTGIMHRPTPDAHNIQLVDFTKKPKYLAGGSGLVSSLTDMMKFGEMILNKGQLNGRRVLSEQAVKEMITPQLGKDFLPLQYNPNIRMGDVSFGFGIAVQINYTDDLRGNFQIPRLGEASWGGGMSTNFWVSPSDKTVFAIMLQIMPYTEDVKNAVRELGYRSIDTYKAQQANLAAAKVIESADVAAGGGIKRSLRHH